MNLFSLAVLLSTFMTGVLHGDDMTPEQKERQKKAVATVQRLTGDRYSVEWDLNDKMTRVAINGVPADSPESISELLGDLGQFRDLELSRAVANDQELQAVSRLTFLESCAISGALVTDDVVSYLLPLKNLEGIVLSNGPLTGANLGRLRACPKLASLYLGHLKEFSPEAAGQICEISSLRRFSVYFTPFKDADVATLGRNKNWTYLQFTKTEITDSALESLATLPRLTHLSLGEDGVTSAGIQSLAKSESIEWMDLRFSKNLDDATIDALAKMPRLRKVMLLDKNNISAEAVKRLAAQRPKLLIQHPATDHYQKVGWGGFME